MSELYKLGIAEAREGLEKGDFSTPPAEPVVEETSAGVEDE